MSTHSGDRTFDYVIFDEASQVLPEDAVPAILRGKHVIVAGDNKQLPPSAFFAAADEDDEADGDATAWFFTRRSVTQCTFACTRPSRRLGSPHEH